jgi:uncharacterized protein YjiS (DUF1127 family)
MAMLSTQFFHRTEGSKVRNDLQPRWNLRPMALIARVVSAVQSELRARRDLAELASLDDRTLRDIGVSRSEIYGLVRRPAVRPQDAHPGWWLRNHQGVSQ